MDTGAAKWDRVRAALDSIEPPLDALVITHPHQDHCGQLDKVIGHVQVAAVYSSGLTRSICDVPTDALFPVAGDELPGATGITITVLANGERRTAGAARLDGTTINNASLVLMLAYAGKRVLLAADAEEELDEELVNRFCPDGPQECQGLRADVLKIPHHGSASFAESFLAAVHPSFAVLSAGFEDKVNHLPRLAAIEAVQALGTAVYSTSAEGYEDVVMTIEGDGDILWNAPSAPLFAWRARGHGQYDAVSLEQGRAGDELGVEMDGSRGASEGAGRLPAGRSCRFLVLCS